MKYSNLFKMRKIILLLVSLVSLVLNAQVIQPFNIIYQKNQRGGLVYLSNAALTCHLPDTLYMPPSNGRNNDGYPSFYVDKDNDPSTFSSSSDSLNLSSCSDITFAALFWGGLADENTTGYPNRGNIKLKFDKGNYINIAADEIVNGVSSIGLSYHCYKDLTSIIKQYGKTNLRLTIANVLGINNITLQSGSFAGWNLVVAYRNEQENLRQSTIYKGLSTIYMGGNPVNINLSGFVTPSQGPVTFDLGVFSYEGDRNFIGDQLLFNGINVADQINPSKNIFNSTISYRGALTPFRIPSYNCNFSIDADIFNPDNTAKNFIGNNANSLTLQIKTEKDSYLTQCVSLAIDAMLPDNRLGMRVKDINGGVVLPGDTLEYTIVASNVGTDYSDNTYIKNKLEGNSLYVPNSIRIYKGSNSGPKTDDFNDDQVDYDPITRLIKVRIGAGAGATNGGTVNYQPTGVDSTVVKFRVTATGNCLTLLCDNVIDNHAYVYGTGRASQIEYESDKVPSQFDGASCTISDISNQSSVIVYNNCVLPNATSNSPVCIDSPIQLQAPTVPDGVYKWTGPGGFVSNEQNPTISKALASSNGLYTVEISIKDKTCAPYSLSTIVSVNNSDIAQAGTDQSICTKSAQLGATKPKAGKGTWSLVSGNAGVTIDSPTSFNSTVNFTTSGSYVFEWSVSNNGCISKDSMILRVGLDCPPVLDNEHHTIRINETASGDLTDGGDSSFDNCFNVTTTPIVQPKHGNISIAADGKYTYTPTLNFVGKDTVVVTICDCQTPPLCGKDTIFITVTHENHVPIAVNDSIYGIYNYDLSKNDKSSEDGGNVWTKTKDPDHGTVVITPDGKCIYTPEPGYIGVDVFKYTITDADGDVSEAIVFVKVYPFFIPEGFSPNGDGPHDRFHILGIENYPKNKFSIFNRWGNKVYEASPYLNDWDGTNMFGVTVGGKDLPVGTYFYILDLGNGSKVYKGTIYLNR